MLRNFQTTTINAAILEIPLNKLCMQKMAFSAPKLSAMDHLDRLENCFKTTYVSKNSFAENKAEPIIDAQQSLSQTRNHTNHVLFTMNSVRQLSHSMMQNSIQIRGFKTSRNIESQLKRNPTFLSRIQQFIQRLISLFRCRCD